MEEGVEGVEEAVRMGEEVDRRDPLFGEEGEERFVRPLEPVGERDARGAAAKRPVENEETNAVRGGEAVEPG